MVEILAKNIENLFDNTDNRKYHGKDCDVWTVSEEFHKNLCDMSDDEFEQKCPDGWWVSVISSNLGSPDGEFEINSYPMLAYYGNFRKDYYGECCWDCQDYYDRTCETTDEEIERCIGEKKYKNLLSYLNEELRIGTERNICAVCVDLARYNNMTMA